jgi:hypothetical protein
MGNVIRACTHKTSPPLKLLGCPLSGAKQTRNDAVTTVR